MGPEPGSRLPPRRSRGRWPRKRPRKRLPRWTWSPRRTASSAKRDSRNWPTSARLRYNAYRRAAELDPQATAPLVALAGLSLAALDLEAAEAAATEAVARNPDAAGAHRILGAVHFHRLRTGDDPETAERAIGALSEAVRLDPDDLQSRSELARLLAASRRGEEAAGHLRELTRLAPDAFGELVLLARLRLAAGDREQAFDYLLRSLRVEPRQPEAREMLDDLLRGEIPGRSREAALAEVVALYEGASAEYPDDQPLRLSLADGLARMGRLDGAAATFERLLVAEPESEIALMGLAMVRREQRRLEDAEQALVRLLAVNDRSVPARLALGGVFAARCEYERAAGEFEALVALPQDSYGLGRRRDVPFPAGPYAAAARTPCRSVRGAGAGGAAGRRHCGRDPLPSGAGAEPAGRRRRRGSGGARGGTDRGS